jgi:hypothetical protein
MGLLSLVSFTYFISYLSVPSLAAPNFYIDSYNNSIVTSISSWPTATTTAIDVSIQTLLLSSRATSLDPSCPPGFLCDQTTCPSNVECPSGDACFNFEGTIACATPSLQWCALNPTTFEAVGCAANGVCWCVLSYFLFALSLKPRNVPLADALIKSRKLLCS